MTDSRIQIADGGWRISVVKQIFFIKIKIEWQTTS